MYESPIDALPATSPMTLKLFKSIHIYTYGDLLNHIPFRYEDYSLLSPIARIQEGEIITVKGMIISSKQEITRKGFRLQKISIQDNTGKLDIVWLNQSYLIHVLKPGLILSVAGVVSRFAGKLTLTPKEWELTNDHHVHTSRIIPIYSEIRGLSSKTIREKIAYVLSRMKDQEKSYEYLPPEILEYNDLMSLYDAYQNIHFPFSHEKQKQARKRLGFDELFVLQLSAFKTKEAWQKKKLKNKFTIDAGIKKSVVRFIKNLPFELTDDQKKVVAEIEKDLIADIPMNRFLQGDVGSGKTVVAAIASYITYLNGYSTVLMAPTEILAQQHFATLSALLNNVSVKVSILTGSQKTKPDPKIPHITIGTQALLHASFKRNDVGLVIIDEQHRFGVSQRTVLRQKGKEAHLLTMTATPIPRTLALTLYGQLDLSLISQMPKGRLKVKTFLVPNEKRAKAYEWITKKIRSEKIQVFVICPLIEESDIETTITVKAAKAEYEFLKHKIFTDFSVALLHGKLKPLEKEKIMHGFSKGTHDILVSTSVVEVGIDVPNAAVMIIEGAERYGLAQLHQLRGRVGRGAHQSFCFLFSESTDDRALKRLNFFSRTGLGVELAEYDLKYRGPGNIFGLRQHGYLRLKVASLSDIQLMQSAKKAAEFIMKKTLNLSDYPDLAAKVALYQTVNEISQD
ncbi:MAG: ATP-dependent DNA helicase RecG [Patescibacteria group bacterium]